MDSAFFGLKRRPFSPVPDPACSAAMESSANAGTALRQCLELGRGVAVLTAPAGLGKTLLCARLADELRGRFAVSFLATPSFAAPRGLLQTLLSELGHRHLRLEEQELRLRLQNAIRQLRPTRAGAIVIADEAHLLPIRVLEELRSLTNLIQEGEPLVRLLLSGQLELEEKLASPALAALAQRIGTHANLVPLNRQESERYLAERVAWAGGRLADVFAPEAVRLVAQASDGVPRALNQLCEQSLLIAAARRERPIREATVREALQELRQLPLHWNLPPEADQVEDNRGSRGASCESDAIIESEPLEIEDGPAAVEFGAVEIGFEVQSSDENRRATPEHFECEPAAPRRDRIELPATKSAQNGAARAVAAPPRGCTGTDARGCAHSRESDDRDELIDDRYAQLDAGRAAAEMLVVAARPPVGRDGVLPEVIDLRKEETRITALERSAASAAHEPHRRTHETIEVDLRETAERPNGKPAVDRAIDRIVPLIDASVREDWTPVALDDEEAQVIESLEFSEDLETQIGSSVIETCMAAQREINARLVKIPSTPDSSESGTAPLERHPRFRRIEPASATDEAEESAERFRPHVNNGDWSDESPARRPGRIPQRRFERLFSDLRRRSRET